MRSEIIGTIGQALFVKMNAVFAEASAGRELSIGWDDLAEAVLSAQEAAGYRIVPAEPTEKMLRAQITKQDWNGVSGQERAAAIYRAMLAAAGGIDE